MAGKRILNLATAALLVTLAAKARAQLSRLLFDANGNLAAHLTRLNEPPRIKGEIGYQTAAPGGWVAFSITLSNPEEVVYEWRFNGSVIGGATNSSLVIVNVSSSDEGSYEVVLTNPSGSVTSAPAMLWIDRDADGMPDSLEQARLGNLNATATGDFDNDGVSNGDEFREGTNPADASSFRPRLRLLSAPYGLGLITTSPGGPPHFALGQVVTMTAVPLRYGSFLGWTGAVSGLKTQISLVMTGHKSVTANFGAPVPPVEPPIFESVSASVGGGGTFSFAWSTIPGRRYQVQFKTNLTQTVWLNLGQPVTATDVSTTLNDAIGANPQRFYRVGLLP